MSLKEPHIKMSKSHQDARSRIHINDNHQVVSDKVRLALTDCMPGVSCDPVNRPGVSNLLGIMSSLDSKRRTAEEIAEVCNAMSMREFKIEVARTISEGLATVRDKYNGLIHPNGAQYLDQVAEEGSMKAQKLAAKTINSVRQATGLE
jgi:tryptophanyl-tRNA synthetase